MADVMDIDVGLLADEMYIDVVELLADEIHIDVQLSSRTLATILIHASVQTSPFCLPSSIPKRLGKVAV